MCPCGQEAFYCVACGGFRWPELDNDTIEFNEEILPWNKGKWLNGGIMLGTTENMSGLFEPQSVVNVSNVPGLFISSKTQWRHERQHHGGFSTKYISVECTDGSWSRRVNAPNSSTCFQDFTHLWIHKHCFTILEKHLQCQTSGIGRPRSILAFVNTTMDRLRGQVSRYAEHFYFSGYAQRGGCERRNGYYGSVIYWRPKTYTRVSGAEWLCANPISVDGLSQFSTFYKTKALNKSRRAAQRFARSHPVPLTSRSPIECLAPELLSLITDSLPLRTILALAATSRTLHQNTNYTTYGFWRTQALRAFGSCLWELHDETLFPPNSHWPALFRELVTAERLILASYQYNEDYGPNDELPYPWWPETKRGRFERIAEGEEGIVGNLAKDDDGSASQLKEFDDKRYHWLNGKPKPEEGEMPLGWMNRLRIWTVLRSVRMDGKEVEVGSLVEW